MYPFRVKIGTEDNFSKLINGLIKLKNHYTFRKLKRNKEQITCDLINFPENVLQISVAK